MGGEAPASDTLEPCLSWLLLRPRFLAQHRAAPSSEDAPQARLSVPGPLAASFNGQAGGQESQVVNSSREARESHSCRLQKAAVLASASLSESPRSLSASLQQLVPPCEGCRHQATAGTWACPPSATVRKGPLRSPGGHVVGTGPASSWHSECSSWEPRGEAMSSCLLCTQLGRLEGTGPQDGSQGRFFKPRSPPLELSWAS